MWKVTGDSTSGSSPYVNHFAVKVRVAGEVVASYTEYSYIKGSARPVVRKLLVATVSLEEYKHFRSKLYSIAAKRRGGEDELTEDEKTFWNNSYCGELSRVATKRKAKEEELTEDEKTFWNNSYGGELSRVAAKIRAKENTTADEEAFWGNSYCGEIIRIAAKIRAEEEELTDVEEALYKSNNIVVINTECTRIRTVEKEKWTQEERAYMENYAHGAHLPCLATWL